MNVRVSVPPFSILLATVGSVNAATMPIIPKVISTSASVKAICLIVPP